MSRYRRVAFTIIIIELLCIVLCNIFLNSKRENIDGRIYRVEAERVSQELLQKEPDDIDLSCYQTIVAVSPFLADETSNNDYVVEIVNDVLYRIEYQAVDKDTTPLSMNIGLTVMFFMTIFVLLYVDRKILKPFHSMSELTYELAKGNLSTPVKEEKSKFFGKFLWGMDMLRENLEEGKKKELALQKEKKVLILSLSHDIKTPLSAIDLYTKALSENLYGSEEKRAEVLQGITKNVQEIKGYVDEIVTASREDFLNLEVNLKEFYLSQVMNVIEAYYRDRFSVLHTQFSVDNQEDCLLWGDLDRVIEVLQNLMENAIKYGDGKKISISVSEEEDCKLITIENTGCTLKEEELPNLFDSFYRGSNSQGIKGSGLGLYIAKSLMKKMDGEIFANVKEPSFCVSVVIRKA